MWEETVYWNEHGHQMLMRHDLDYKDLPKESLLFEVGSARGDEGSTKALATMAKVLKMGFVTVDMDPVVTAVCREDVKAIDPSFEAVCDRGELYAATITQPIGIAYLDAYDTMAPGFELPEDMKAPYIQQMGNWSNEDAWQMHLKTAIAVDQNMVVGGYVCFDDVWRMNGEYAKRSKGYMAIPWLLNHGYKEVDYTHGCMLLKKTSVVGGL